SFSTVVGYGAEGNSGVGGFNEQKGGIVDLIASFTGDRFSAYLNADYDWLQGTSQAAWGLSAAGKVKLTDMLWTALRLEYAQDQSDFFALMHATAPPGLGGHHSEIYGATGTLAYEIAQNL